MSRILLEKNKRIMKTIESYVKEFFGEILFVSCPTEIKEPFFWKWTNDGKEIIESYLLTSLEEYGKQCEEKGRGEALSYVAENVWYENKQSEDRLKAVLESARQSDNK